MSSDYHRRIGFAYTCDMQFLFCREYVNPPQGLIFSWGLLLINGYYRYSKVT